MKKVDFSETIAACDLKIGRCTQLIELMKVCKYDKSSLEPVDRLHWTFVCSTGDPGQYFVKMMTLG